MRCIVSTGPKGWVYVTHPALETMAFLTNGGAPDGHFGRIDRDYQIDEMVKRGVREAVAVKWITIIFTGGLTDAGAYELIRDRDTKPEWSGKELWDRSELPDRWYRGAWRRSQNGGPIEIDIPAARAIQFKNITAAIDSENKRRCDDLDQFDAPVECDLTALRERIRSADDELALRAIWPDGLS